MSKRQRIFQGVLMALFMSLSMSTFMTILNVGLGSYFFQAWLRGWGIGFIVSLPLTFLLPPFIQWLIKKIGIK